MAKAMHGEVANMAAQLRSFAEHTSQGIDELRRAVQSRPCNGPSVFRDSLQELMKQEKVLQAEVSTLAQIATSSPTVVELLAKCLSAYQDNQARIKTLEGHLQQYGYTTQQEFPAPSDPLAGFEASISRPAPPGLGPLNAPPPSSALQVEPRTNSSASAILQSLQGTGFKPADPSRIDASAADVQLSRPVPMLTPSPLATSSVSATSLSPSIRDLNRKYGRDSDASRGSKDRDSLDNMLAARMSALMQGQPLQQPSQPSSLSSGLPAQELRRQPSKDQLTAAAGVKADAAVSRSDSAELGSQEGSGSLSHASANGHATRKDNLNAKLASGEAPWDMISLRAAINGASCGTGEIERAVAGATFHPQAAAFTALLHMCSKGKLWEKAWEVFQAMKVHHPNVQPNTVHFSCLMSACATAGRWQEAEQIFHEMEAASKHDPQCAPNVISYSAVMTACCMGGHPAKAEDWFKHMRARNIKPDHICYSTLIAGFEKFNNMEQARFYHDEMVRAGMTPRASQSLDAGMSHADSSALRAAKPLGLTPMSSRVGMPSKPLTINTTPHHPSASRLGASMPSYQAPDTGLSILEPPDSIPAYFGHPGLGMQNDESTIELRRNMLRTRSPHALGGTFPVNEPLNSPHYAAQIGRQAGSGYHTASQLGGYPRTPEATSMPFNGGRGSTPSTDELLRAAALGSSGSRFFRGAPNQAAPQQQSSYAFQQPPAPPPLQQQQQQPEQAFQRSLLSHHSAPQSMLSHFAEANISQSHMAQEMQSWEQQGSLKGLTSQFHGAEHAAGSGYHNGGQGLLRHASAVAQLESLAGAHHAPHGSMLPRIPSSHMASSNYQPSDLQPHHSLGQTDLQPDAFSYFNNAQLHNASLLGASQASFTEPSRPAADAFMSQQAAQAPSEDMFGMPLGRSTASHHPSSAPFAIAPGAEMQAAKRNGLEQEVAASIPPLPPAVHAQLISSEEFQSLPPRFSRQLSVEVLNGVLEFIRQTVANNQSNPPGITQLELEPLQLETSQATALINALLHLHRLRLNVSHGVTSYTLVQ